MNRLPKEVYKKTVREFQRVPAMKSLLREREKQYKENVKKRLENPQYYYAPYRSPANIELDVPVGSGYSHDGPQVGMTIAFRTKYENDIIKFAGEIADLEQLLDSAIDKAVRDAKECRKREGYRRALCAHLYKKIPAKELDIGRTTLIKYRDKAVYNAAKMLGYI